MKQFIDLGCLGIQIKKNYKVDPWTSQRVSHTGNILRILKRYLGALQVHGTLVSWPIGPNLAHPAPTLALLSLRSKFQLFQDKPEENVFVVLV